MKMCVRFSFLVGVGGLICVLLVFTFDPGDRKGMQFYLHLVANYYVLFVPDLRDGFIHAICRSHVCLIYTFALTDFSILKRRTCIYTRSQRRVCGVHYICSCALEEHCLCGLKTNTFQRLVRFTPTAAASQPASASAAPAAAGKQVGTYNTFVHQQGVCVCTWLVYATRVHVDCVRRAVVTSSSTW